MRAFQDGVLAAFEDERTQAKAKKQTGLNLKNSENMRSRKRKRELLSMTSTDVI